MENKNDLEKNLGGLTRQMKISNSFWHNFWRGVIFGIDYTIGASIVVGIILGLLSQFFNIFKSAVK